MSRGGLYAAYRAATSALAPLAPLLASWRVSRGKELPQRVSERFGTPGMTRPDGSLLWLHGASIGESLAMLPVIDRLTARGFRLLVTTGTVSSAAVLGARLPAGAAHQFVPYDATRFVRRFLEHWRPQMLLLAESELWPNLVFETHARSIPVMMINARLSQRSFERWRRAPKLLRKMLDCVELCLAQTDDDARRFATLGAAHAQAVGNLKYDTPAPPFDPAQLAALRGQIGSRPVWFAASTHPGEDAAIVAVHERLASVVPDLLTIVAPRHAHRGAEVAGLAQRRGARVARRSSEHSIDAQTGVYVADTMGEMGLFFRLAGIVFVGKSLDGAHGGQNPIEPAKLGAMVLHGPNVQNFAEVYDALDAAGGAMQVTDAPSLAAALQGLFADPARLRHMAERAAKTVETFTGAAQATVQALDPWLLQIQVEGR